MATMFDKVTVRNEPFENLPTTVMQLRGSGASHMVLNFSSVADMRFFFTDLRIEMLQLLAERGALRLGEMAAKLKRSRTAVARDVAALARTGVIETERVDNPGHGQNTLVKPLARHYEFVWRIGAAPAMGAAKPAKRRAA